MALAVNRTGTISKKCARSNHKPETNKKCAAGTCQHTCDKPHKCPHAWTLRYALNGKQLDKFFKDTANENTGRVNYGSGKKLAQDFQLKLTASKGEVTVYRVLGPVEYKGLGRGEACLNSVAHFFNPQN